MSEKCQKETHALRKKGCTPIIASVGASIAFRSLGINLCSLIKTDETRNSFCR